MRNKILCAILSLFLTAIGLFSQTSAFATPKDRDRGDEFEEIVMTGMRVRQGGAQDINHFRGEVSFARIPHPNDITAEGLLGDHDIVLPAKEVCQQLFCLTGEASNASLIAAPHAKYLVGVGFATNLDIKHWHREPLNLVAVVDKSGSMDGEPLQRVRESLIEITKQLRQGDQLSIVLYGDRAHVYMKPTMIDSDSRSSVIHSIKKIVSEGSTYMEEGLKVGYEVATQTARDFHGRTRVMLFTDEQPNVGNTSAAGFMGMATEASKAGIGLTTIGVGVQFDDELAVKVSSVRGGNLFFLRDENDVKSVFASKLDYMVSELAHDLELTITPMSGLKIAAVYGIPGELMGWQNENTVRVKIPTVFLDVHGGGIFFTLSPDSSNEFLPAKNIESLTTIASVKVSYSSSTSTQPQPDAHSIEIASNNNEPSPGMKLGQALIDEFTVLHEATSAHHLRNDQESAYQLLTALQSRLKNNPDRELDSERELVAGLLDQITFLSGHGSEVKRNTPFAKLWGRWKVTNATGNISIRTGEILEFMPDGNFKHFSDGKAVEPFEEEDYKSNNTQIYLGVSELVFSYGVNENSLRLNHHDSGAKVLLVRVPNKGS